jgi:hypothetical protein
MDREEVLFRTLERHIVNERLRRGFSDGDEFVAFSLSVQNRRKARAGRALEKPKFAFVILSPVELPTKCI